MGRIYVKKVYPIKGRKDFYKYVVIDNGVIAKGWQGNSINVEMYFDSKVHAERVANARRKVRELNKLVTSKTSKKQLLIFKSEIMAKKKISKFEAYKMAKKIGVNFKKDYYAQSFGNELSALAKLTGYKKPKTASGSTGRYFFEHLDKLRIKHRWQ